MSSKDVSEEGREESGEAVICVEEDGVEIMYGVLAYCEYDGANYSVCVPFEQLQEEGAEEEYINVYVFRHHEDAGGSLDLEQIDDDDIIDELIRALQKEGVLPELGEPMLDPEMAPYPLDS